MIYPFLTATLPVLRPGSETDFSLRDFDLLAESELSERLFRRMTSWDDPSSGTDVPVYAEMRRFQEYLRYRIARLRAEKLDRGDRFEEPSEFYGEIDFALSNAVSAPPLEREALIDAACWRKLDDLEIGHEMDFEHLCIYRLRLIMLGKYAGRGEERGRENFEAALDKLAAGFNEV